MRTVFTLTLILIITFITFGQDYAADKGAFIISGKGNFNLDKDSDNKPKPFTLITSLNYFVEEKFYFGAMAEWSTLTVNKGYKSKSMGIGPKIGYTIGNAEAQAFINFNVGVIYFGFHEDVSVTNLILGAGLLIPLKDHLGICLDISYHNPFIDNSESNFSFGVGIAILLYEDKEISENKKPIQ